jgi:release factor glutamine methyltransferase
LADLAVARHEPRAALDGGEDGLTVIRRLVEDAPRWLAPGGLLLLEIQYDQGERTAKVCQQALPGAKVQVEPDFAGLPRLVSVEQPNL